jgi:VWFA-related protein
MTRSSARLALLLVSSIGPALAQSPAPTTPPKAPQSSQTPAASTAPVQTIKTNAQLVVVDVVVTDSAGKPIHGLKASNFNLKESGTPQVIRNFEEHSAATLADATKFAPMPKLPPGIFTNYSPAPANGAVDVLLLDTLNTPIADQAYARQQILAYLKSTPPGTRIAIFGLSSHLILLQGFTSDPEVLKTVMEKGYGKGSPLLNDQVGGAGIQNSEADTLEDNLDPADTSMADMISRLREFDAKIDSFQLQLRARYTLEAMNEIARFLSVIPGRKNLIWFSGSFPLDIMPNSDLDDPFSVMADAEDEFRDTVGMLARAQVAVYPVDARGLMNSPVFSAATGRNYGGANGNQRMTQDQNKFFTDTAAEHSTMLQMAADTGGRAFLNTNGLTHAVATAIDEGSNFYTISYTPTNPQRDGKFRKINVQLSPGGYTLAYRQGYYADDPDRITKSPAAVDHAVSAANAPTPRDTMRAAMTRGVPPSTEILIKVGVVPINAATKPEDTPAAGNTPAANTKGPYRRYSVNYQIDPNGLSFTRTSDGKLHTRFELLIFVFDSTGAILNSTGGRVEVNATLDETRKMFTEGIFRHEEISAPIKGQYFLRIAVHDLIRDRFGAVEVATAQVNNVTPPTPPPPASNPQPPK